MLLRKNENVKKHVNEIKKYINDFIKKMLRLILFQEINWIMKIVYLFKEIKSEVNKIKNESITIKKFNSYS